MISVTINSMALGLAWGLLRCPFFIRQLITNIIISIFLLAKRRKKIIDASIQKALPDLSQADVVAIRNKSIRNTVENALHILDYKNCAYRIESIDGDQDVLDQLKRSPSVIASMHMGIAELPTMALNQLDIKTRTVIGKGDSAPLLHQLGIKILNFLQIPFHSRADSSMLKLAQSIDRGESVMIHSDLRDKGPSLRFLGHTTSVPNTAAALAAFANRPLYFCYAEMNHNRSGIHRIIIKKIDTKRDSTNKRAIINALTDNLVSAMEDAIMSQPEQWFWSYNRFK